MLSKKSNRVDVLLCEYFAELLDSGRPYNDASYTLFGYIVLRADEDKPERDLFPRARQALKGWNSKYPQCSRTGADFQIWFLIALHICKVDPMYAAILLLQLDTYARPSEILEVKRRDVIKPSSRQCKFWGIIFGNSLHTEKIKTGTQDDTVILDSLNGFATTVLKMVFGNRAHDESPLFPNASLSQYETLVKEAKREAGLVAFTTTPHSVRHSGPSVDFLNKSRLPEEIMARGRWKCPKSIQRYRKPGQMLARMNKIPQSVWDNARDALTQVLIKLRNFYGVKSPHQQF